jgi:hypothetical protein
MDSDPAIASQTLQTDLFAIQTGLKNGEQKPMNPS